MQKAMCKAEKLCQDTLEGFEVVVSISRVYNDLCISFSKSDTLSLLWETRFRPDMEKDIGFTYDTVLGICDTFHNWFIVEHIQKPTRAKLGPMNVNYRKE